jgi:hypothetical protein
MNLLQKLAQLGHDVGHTIAMGASNTQNVDFGKTHGAVPPAMVSNSRTGQNQVPYQYAQAVTPPPHPAWYVGDEDQSPVAFTPPPEHQSLLRRLAGLF